MDYARLLNKCQKKDRQAQKALYNLFKDKMMGICLRYAARKEEAEDIFQEAFIKVFKNISNVREPEKLEVWIRRIIINTAINHYHSPHNSRVIKSIDGESEKEPNQDFEDTFDKISNEQLRALINELPNGYRIVFNLYVVDGYTHPEIAEMLQISVGTSKSQLSDAKSSLREKLKTLGIDRYERAR